MTKSEIRQKLRALNQEVQSAPLQTKEQREVHRNMLDQYNKLYKEYQSMSY